jgi:hypothetical protein
MLPFLCKVDAAEPLMMQCWIWSLYGLTVAHPLIHNKAFEAGKAIVSYEKMK